MPSRLDLLAPPRADAERLARGEHHDPHAILGAHPAEDGIVVRAFHPAAAGATVLTPGGPHEMQSVGNGIWGALLPDSDGGAVDTRYRLRFSFPGAVDERTDPYRFAPTLGELDLHLIGEGTHERLYDVLGAHPRTVDGVDGVAFAVWAPSARSVRVAGDFNLWDGRLLPMRSLGASGVWELFVPGINAGELYKFEILGADGQLRLKTDPLAFSMELRPLTASRVWDLDGFAWTDEAWLQQRAERDPYRSPMAIYEVHLGSWRRNGDGSWLGYRDAGRQLADHCRRFGFTHVEFMPLAEHPFDGSWGYQVTGYYAPTSRFGTPDDVRAMIDELHAAGIGVILDWVPAHFPTDAFALAQFDGTALYEHANPQLGRHPDWGTLIFNYGRREVRNFLVANALFWLDRYHVDGLRVDAVASMLYLDYSREAGEWVPNRYGGRENLEAIAFLREFNERCHGLFPGIVTIAEESTAFPGVTRPTYAGGLGFGFKWDMGWMHDTLDYFSRDPIHRRYHQDRLTFRALYMHTEQFILPLSHDEVVHLKGSLLAKMPGDEWQRFANLRALLADMYTQPGKKLLFMGSELGAWQEWNHDAALPWEREHEPMPEGLGRFLADLGAIYATTPALWLSDPDPSGFGWIDCTDVDASVVAWTRGTIEDGGFIVAVHNLTPVVRHGYRLGMPRVGRYDEILNSDSAHYGGSNVGNLGGLEAVAEPFHGLPASTLLTLPPLASLILRPR
ncbi:MAG: 1,4-alpha-glucan branching protein GlgB [Chloroflexota bacterium]|nr:1,4-alpha-glucan branching protein GlgB [Chloroflexota bacterium]